MVQAEKLLLWDIFQGKSIRTESLHAGQKCGNERGAQLRAEIPTGECDKLGKRIRRNLCGTGRYTKAKDRKMVCKGAAVLA